jgi:hypothetical protein
VVLAINDEDCDKSGETFIFNLDVDTELSGIRRA